MAKKKIIKEMEDDDVPDGKQDEDGDDLIDLYDEKDDLTDDVDYDLSKIEDDMLVNETEAEELPLDVKEIVKTLRTIKCTPCSGSSSKRDCKIRHDYGCPPDKAKK